MASSRLLHLVFSPRAAVEVASFKKWPFQRRIHVVAAPSSPNEIQHLQFKIEGVISEVGGKMVVADMRFSRDAFDYWRNAAIPSDSIVKNLASTWANMKSLSSTSCMPFRFYADRTVGKKMEDFLQRMVADVEQRITREGFNPLKGRKLVVRLADEQELMVAKEGNSEFKQVLDGRLDLKHGFSRSIDVPSADEQGLMVKEGKPEAEQAFDRRLEPQESRAKEEKIEAEQEFDERLVAQLSDKQEVMAKVEKSVGKQERLYVQESAVKEEKSEVMQVQSARIVTCRTQQQGAAAQRDKLENQFVKEKGVEMKDGQLAADGQRAMEKEKNLEVIHRIKEKEGAEIRKAESRRRLVSAQESMVPSMKSAACMEQQLSDVQKGEAESQHGKEMEFEREDTLLAADEQKAMEKGKKLEATHRAEKKESTEVQKREAEKQIYEGGKDYSQQTDNIVWKTRRMGRKVVHIYYDKSSAGRVSLYR